MSDIRVSMREFRFLEEKRKLAPLTPVEEQRWMELGQTLGIFELPNADDVVEIDPSDVVLVEPGFDGADGNTAAAADDTPVPLTQNFEWVPPYQGSAGTVSIPFDPGQAQGTFDSPDAAHLPSAIEPRSTQAEESASSGEAPEPSSVTPAPEASEPPANKATALNGLSEDAGAQTAPPDASYWRDGAETPVIDLAPADATPSAGMPIVKDAEQPDDCAGVPHLSADVPDDSAGVSHHWAGLPHDSGGVSDASAGVPHDWAGLAHDSGGVSDASARAAHDSADVRRDSADLPHDSADVPRDPAGESPACADVPQDFANLAHDSAGSPHDAAAEPQASESWDDAPTPSLAYANAAPLGPAPAAEPDLNASPDPAPRDAIDGWTVAAGQAFPTTSPQFRNPLAASVPLVEGERRVVIHLLDGQIRRGSVKDLNLASGIVPLTSAGPVDNLAVDRLKAIFFMLAPGAARPASVGKKIRVIFQDGREVSGFSTDYQTGEPGFFLVPADLKTNTERIFVFRWSIYSIAEE